MAAGEKKKLIGRIILVQEDRFRMVGNTGRGYLFMLSHKARTSHADLERWHDANVPVMVEFEGEPNLATGIAHKVEPRPELS